jgi:hypothetical protein
MWRGNDDANFWFMLRCVKREVGSQGFRGWLSEGSEYGLGRGKEASLDASEALQQISHFLFISIIFRRQP